MKCQLVGRRPQIESERKAKEATAPAQTSLAASRHQIRFEDVAQRAPQIESERKAKEATAPAQTSLAASRHQPIVVLAQPFGLTFRVLLAAQLPVDLQQKIPGERQARRQGDTLLRLLSRAFQSAGLK